MNNIVSISQRKYDTKVNLLKTMKEKPLVTVIVPAYNHEKYVIECLDSIYNQTYKNFQWIVVDDKSQDSTPNILKDKQSKYGYHLILHEENKGLSATLTEVLSLHAEGRYIAICASDDFWCKDKLERQVEYLEHHPECAIVFGKMHYVDTSSKMLPEKKYTQNYRGGYIFNEIITQKFHPPVNYMYRHDILRRLGYFKAGVIAEDFYMNCLISHEYNFGYIDDYLGFYRVEELSKKRSPYSLMKSIEDTIRIFYEYPIYKDAIHYHNLLSFYILSSYKKHKLQSLTYAIKSIKSLFSVMYLKGLLHLILFYK